MSDNQDAIRLDPADNAAAQEQAANDAQAAQAQALADAAANRGEPTTPADAAKPVIKADDNKRQIDSLSGLPSAMAATGGMVKLPKTPDEIAAQATKLGNSGDHATGGNETVAGNLGYQAEATPASKRHWALDTDVNTAHRNDFDPLKPDASDVR
jgi:hypothetical protein